MKLFFLFTIIIVSLSRCAFAQSNNAEVDIVQKLKNYMSTHEQEKAYLQFDKPYYMAGDTIYFKAYISEGEQRKLSLLSRILHVDLINDDNEIEQSIQLKLDSGICWGDFALPDSLPSGNYHIRAYTQWMRNFGPHYFFDKIIPIGYSINKPAQDTLINRLSSLSKNVADIQFFPEGGTLVEEIQTKIAYKAIGSDGLALNVKGVIVDKENNVVCPLGPSHFGMGYFMLKPAKNNSYRAMISFSDGSKTMVDLPKQESSGISLSLINDSTQSLSIIVKANAAYFAANSNKDFLLVIYTGGKALTYNFKQDVPKVILDIRKELLQTGITTITLFSLEGQPLCERLLFVQNNDMVKLQINADKATYKKKEKVRLQLNAVSPAGLSFKGHLSMAIIDESLMPINENIECNILTSMLLTSDLKGFVEQPNYYFKDVNQETRNNLDLLMLTQGYRDFEWGQVLNKHPLPFVYQPEIGLEIKGKVTDRVNKPISKGTVTLIPSKGGPVLTSITDSNGLFKFSNLVFEDSLHFILNATSSTGDKNTKITWFGQNDQPEVLSDSSSPWQNLKDSSTWVYNQKAPKKNAEMVKNNGKGKLLQTVIVNGVKQENQYRTESVAGIGGADQVMHADEIEKIGGRLSAILYGRLHGIDFVSGVPYLRSSSNYAAQPMLVILDGSEVNYDKTGSSFNIDNIPASEVETIEVLKNSSSSAYGLEGGNGVLVITTKNGNTGGKSASLDGILDITAKGFYKSRVFYSPKYNPQDVDSTLAGPPPIIYWNPEIKMDKDGMAFLEYYNSGAKGIYKVIVEGIDADGNIGRLVYRYRVE